MVFEAERVAELDREIDRDDHRQLWRGHQRNGERCGAQCDRQCVGQRGCDDASSDRPEPFRGMLTVGMHIARIVDQVGRGCGQAERHKRDRHFVGDVAVVVVDLAAQSGQRSSDHQDVFDPLPRSQRFDDANRQIGRRADLRRRVAVHDQGVWLVLLAKRRNGTRFASRSRAKMTPVTSCLTSTARLRCSPRTDR